MITIPFTQLEGVHLTAGTVYEGGDAGNISDDPLAKLLKGGNSGGFRYCGSVENLKYLIITIATDNHQWRDTIDPQSGTIVCYGDNRLPGHSIHDTPKHGNLILKNIFKSLLSNKEPRCHVPPIFLFSKHPTKASPRSIQFLGLCAPGSPGMPSSSTLTRTHRRLDAKRFWNYRATFTLLDIPVIKRAWLDDLETNTSDSPQRPIVWKMWQKSGLYRPLQRGPRFAIRSTDTQLPTDNLHQAMLIHLYRYFASENYKFLHVAAAIFALTDSKISLGRIRRHSSDGAYTISGDFRLGIDADPVFLKFVLEAKCYNPGIGNRKRKSVGIKELMKLISRLENRHFGVLVTTSVVTRQAYEELRKRNHPVVCIAGADIIDILISNNISTFNQLTDWLFQHHPDGT